MTKELPLVSAVIPAYNAAKYIEQTIDSILHQTYPNIEIVVVNDGSTDETVQKLEQYGSKVRIVTQKNGGCAAARSRGVHEARGELIAFIDADDYWFPEKTQTQVSYLDSHPDVGAVYCEWVVWEANDDGEFVVPANRDKDNPPFTLDTTYSGWIYPELIMESRVHTSACMVRRAIAQQVGDFDSTLRIGEDYDYWIRMSRVTKIDKLKNQLSCYRIHRESITKKVPAINYEYEVAKKAVGKWGLAGPDGTYLQKNRYLDRMAKLCFDFGYTHYKFGDRKIARKALFDAIKYRPLRYRTWLVWALNFLKGKNN